MSFLQLQSQRTIFVVISGLKIEKTGPDTTKASPKMAKKAIYDHLRAPKARASRANRSKRSESGERSPEGAASRATSPGRAHGSAAAANGRYIYWTVAGDFAFGSSHAPRPPAAPPGTRDAASSGDETRDGAPSGDRSPLSLRFERFALEARAFGARSAAAAALPWAPPGDVTRDGAPSGDRSPLSLRFKRFALNRK